MSRLKENWRNYFEKEIRNASFKENFRPLCAPAHKGTTICLLCMGLPLIPEPSGRSFIISSISFSSKAAVEEAGLMFLVASERPAWSRSKVSEWDRPLLTPNHSEAVEGEAGDKLDETFEGGVRLFDLHGLGVRFSRVGLLIISYCTMLPVTPLIVTWGVILLTCPCWLCPPRSLAVSIWLVCNDWSQ